MTTGSAGCKSISKVALTLAFLYTNVPTYVAVAASIPSGSGSNTPSFDKYGDVDLNVTIERCTSPRLINS